MERSTRLLAVTLALYILIFILGFIQAAGLGLATQRLNGCPLFSETTNYGTFFGSYHNCNFVIYMPVILSIIFGLLMVIYHAYALVQALRQPNIVADGSVSKWIVTSVIGLILTLIGAALMSAGMYWFCLSNRFLLAQFFGAPTTCVPGETTALLFRGYDPYSELRMSEAAYWLAACLWFAVVILTILRASTMGKESGSSSAGFSGSNPFTLLPGKKSAADKKKVLSSSSAVQYEQAGVLETKIRPLETAA